MELQRMKLENIKECMMRGGQVDSTRVENGSYIVQMQNGVEVTFDENYKDTVDNTLHKAENGIRDGMTATNVTD